MFYLLLLKFELVKCSLNKCVCVDFILMTLWLIISGFALSVVSAVTLSMGFYFSVLWQQFRFDIYVRVCVVESSLFRPFISLCVCVYFRADILFKLEAFFQFFFR